MNWQKMINKVVKGRSKILPIDQHNHPVKRDLSILFWIQEK